MLREELYKIVFREISKLPNPSLWASSPYGRAFLYRTLPEPQAEYKFQESNEAVPDSTKLIELVFIANELVIEGQIWWMVHCKGFERLLYLYPLN